MRTVAFIEQPAVIKRILHHLALLPSQVYGPPGRGTRYRIPCNGLPSLNLQLDFGF
jgi:hypothetical protein